MRLVNIKINNFRGIRRCDLNLPEQTVLVGDNNTGKSTVLEAIDLVLGPERLSRRPVIDEHDFYAGQYLDREGNAIEITVEAIITGLSEEQLLHFRNNLEFWNYDTSKIVAESPESTDAQGTVPCLRVCFHGYYDAEEDDFSGDTYFCSPQVEDSAVPHRFTAREKRLCGFLYLRTLRTGSRALSLERGSLLDIILRQKDLKLHMWEEVLTQLREIPIAVNPELGISEVLDGVQDSVRKLVTKENANAPVIRVSQLTREHLRQVLTVFLDTGSVDNDGRSYAAPFHHQGTGTINTLVLALLSMIAELKQNVIFAMEEPEIAIPPHTQKRIIDSVIGNSAQAIFTSHSPFVLEEFKPEQIVVINRIEGSLTGTPMQLPRKIQQKAYVYRDDLKRRFCEALLARRVLIVEGQTEYLAISRVARKLSVAHRGMYSSLESLGIAVVCAESDSQIAGIGSCFRRLGKETYAIFDKQAEENLQEIATNIDYPYESQEDGFENVIVNETNVSVLRTYTQQLFDDSEWPNHLGAFDVATVDEKTLKELLFKFFTWKKAGGAVADLLEICSESEMPSYITDTLKAIRATVISESMTVEDTIVPDTDTSAED